MVRRTLRRSCRAPEIQVGVKFIRTERTQKGSHVTSRMGCLVHPLTLDGRRLKDRSAVYKPTLFPKGGQKEPRAGETESGGVTEKVDASLCYSRCVMA